MMKSGMNITVKMLTLALFSALAMTSCMVERFDNDAGYAAEQPVANYQVFGNVTDEEGKPVSGIRVIADYSTDVVYRADTLYTDKEGEYSKFLTIPRVDGFFLTFTDIDGQANGGEFESRSERVNPVRTEISSGYFGGSYIVSFDATLKRK